MKFKLDENLPTDLANDLRLVGHDADTVMDENLCGAPDAEILRAALSEMRIVMTLDKDLANLLQYPAFTHAGVVLFRPGESGPKATLRFIRSRLEEVLSRDLANCLTVVSRQGIRTR